MRRLLSLLGFALITAAAVAACGGDPERPKASPDTPVQPIGSMGGGGGDAGGVRDASVDAPTADAGSTCHDLTLTGIDVQETGVAGDPQGGTGGALVDGNYDLVEAQKFVGTGTPGATGVTYKVSIRITGQTIDRFVRQGAIDKIQRGTFAISGSGLTFAITCPVATQEQLTYSIVNNNLILTDVIGRTSWTFTKK